MVASPKNPNPQDFTAHLAHLQRQIDELGRQVKYPFSVSNGDDRILAITPNAVDPSIADFTLKDSNGTQILANDKGVLFGLRSPELAHPLYKRIDNYSPAANNVEGALYSGWISLYNPVWSLMTSMELTSTGAATAEVWYEFNNVGSTQKIFSTKETVTVNNSTAGVNMTRHIPMPAVWMGKQIQCVYKGQVTAGAASGTTTMTFSVYWSNGRESFVGQASHIASTIGL